MKYLSLFIYLFPLALMAQEKNEELPYRQIPEYPSTVKSPMPYTVWAKWFPTAGALATPFTLV